MPAAIAVTPDVNPDTCTGTEDDDVELFPKRPNSVGLPLEPQHLAEPETAAQEWASPAEIAVTPDVKPDTCTGTLDCVVELLPSRPALPEPQHMAPPDTIAQA